MTQLVCYTVISFLVLLVTSGRALGVEPLPRYAREGSYTSAIAFAPDGKTFVACGEDLIVCNSVNGEKIATLESQEGEILSASFSPDGKLIAVGGTACNVTLYSTTTFRVSQILKGHDRYVSGLVFTPDGRCLISGSFDQTVRVWDLQKGTSAILGRLENKVTCVAIAPDGKRLASGCCEGIITIWDLEKKIQSGQLKMPAMAQSLTFTKKGTWLMAGSNFGLIMIWDSSKLQLLHRFGTSSRSLRSISVNPDETRLAVATGDPGILWQWYGRVEVWDLDQIRRVSRFVAHKRWVTVVGFSPTGNHLLSGGAEGVLRMWDMRERK